MRAISSPESPAAPSAQGAPIDPLDVIALDDALARLAVLDPQKARLVELRYFAGLSILETAAALGVSTATIRSRMGHRADVAPPRSSIDE